MLAHGSTVNFQGEADDEDKPTQANFIDLDQLGERIGELDYIALGDWHGFQQAGDKAWYAGSHETDRFPRSGQLPGQVACVQATRGGIPQVEAVATGAVRWGKHAENFVAADGPGQLNAAHQQLTAGAAIGNAVVKLRLDGHLGLDGHQVLAKMIHTWRAQFADLRDENNVALQPTASELNTLTTRADDPLISRVARMLAS